MTNPPLVLKNFLFKRKPMTTRSYPRANFEVIEYSPYACTIADVGPHDHHPTVTNDAEAVVDLLVRMCPRHNWTEIRYFDSNGDLWSLMVKEGKFAGFQSGGRKANP